MSKRILVVDDDVDYLSTMCLRLEGAGYEIKSAESVGEAKKLLDSFTPDLAILDLMMDEVDGGFVLCHAIKKKDEAIPVIVVSAVTSETGMSFGATSPHDKKWIKADAWLAKPVRFEQLQGELKRLLEE